MYRYLASVVTTLLLLCSPLHAQFRSLTLADPTVSKTLGIWRLWADNGTLQFQRNTAMDGSFSAFVAPITFESNGELHLILSAVASPYTTPRLTIYRDSSDWAFFTYGTDSTLRLAYSSTTGSRCFQFGKSTAFNGTGSFTSTQKFCANGQVLMADGSAGTPTYSWDSENSTGIYRMSGGMAYTSTGTAKWAWGTTSINLNSTYQLTFGNSSDPTGGADTTLTRVSAGIFGMTGLAVSGTTGLGYVTGGGTGGTVTQATSKSTGVTLNKVTGQVTMNNAALASAAKVTFTVTNSTVAAVDLVSVNVVSGGTANAYRAAVTAVAAGSFAVTVENITGGSLSEAPVIGFAVIKGSAN